MAVDADWVVSDNTTLTDAARLVTNKVELDSGLGNQCFVNWLNFIESLVLHGKILADNHVFENQKDIQHLCSFFPGLVDGIDLGDQRKAITTSVRRALQGKKDSDSPAEWSHLHRGLFYIEVARMNNLPYKPAFARERAFDRYLKREWVAAEEKWKGQNYQQLSTNILENIQSVSDQYKKELEELGAPAFVEAELPPLASLIFQTASKVGSWSEAIYLVRDSNGAKAFRSWIKEITECLEAGDIKARRELEQAAHFMKGWSSNPNEGIKYKSRSIKLSLLDNYLETGIRLPIKDPVLYQRRHLVFLSGLVKAKITPIDKDQFLKIEL